MRRAQKTKKDAPLTLGPCIRRGFSYFHVASVARRLDSETLSYPLLWPRLAIFPVTYKHKLSPRRGGARRVERCGARERHGTPRGGVFEGELCAVQAEALVRRAAVERVAEQRVADRREVHAQLVRSPGPGLECE